METPFDFSALEGLNLAPQAKKKIVEKIIEDNHLVKTEFDRDNLNKSYLKMNELRIKEKEEKADIEFSRYKQDCRKKALDFAVSEWGDFVRVHLMINPPRENKKPPELLELADKYYNWLISIP